MKTVYEMLDLAAATDGAKQELAGHLLDYARAYFKPAAKAASEQEKIEHFQQLAASFKAELKEVENNWMSTKGADKLPTCWRQYKSDLSSALAKGINLLDTKTFSQAKQALQEVRKKEKAAAEAADSEKQQAQQQEKTSKMEKLDEVVAIQLVVLTDTIAKLPADVALAILEQATDAAKAAKADYSVIEGEAVVVETEQLPAPEVQKPARKRSSRKTA